MNTEQISCWNGDVGRKWASFHAELDRMLAPLDKILFDRIPLSPTDRVLDVGCGCGATSIELARRAGAVTGLDVSEPMLEVARKRARSEQPNIAFLHADAATHRFAPESFDLLFSRFGTMFFDEPVAAFANLRHALKEGGRLSFLCWRPAIENPWVMVPLGAALQVVPPPDPTPPRAPGPFAFAEPDYVGEILEGAGFSEIEVEPVDAMLKMGSTTPTRDQIDFFERIGPVAGVLAGQPSDVQERVREGLVKALEQHRTDQGIELGAACWFVSARN